MALRVFSSLLKKHKKYLSLSQHVFYVNIYYCKKLLYHLLKLKPLTLGCK
jgi:hypothetical protein